MALRGDSYGTLVEVLAFTKHLLDGEATFNAATKPTDTEIEKFIDRASGILNVAMEGVGLTTPVINSTAKLACDDWVVSHATAYVELTQRGAGYDGTENTRAGSFLHLHDSAAMFAEQAALGFQRLGVSSGSPLSDGLQFTGEEIQKDRDDPDDTSLEQPKFSRGLFDAG